MYDKFSESEKQEFIRQVRLEAAKAKVAFSVKGNFEDLLIEKRLPITDKFSESDLIEGIGEVNFSAIVVLDTIGSYLEHKLKQPSPTPNTEASPL